MWGALRLRRSVRSDQRVGVGKEHCQTDTDQERRIDKTHRQEHLGLKRRYQLGLTATCLKELGGHDADADAGPGSAQPMMRPIAMAVWA